MSFFNLKIQNFLLLVSAFFVLYSLGQAPLDLSQAKPALNVAYPYPPLFRFLTTISQEAFGFNNWAARLPIIILGALTVGLIFLFLVRFGVDWWASLFLTFAFAASYPWALLVREGLINTTAVFFWLLAFWAIANLEKDFANKSYHWLLLLSFIGGLWSQLQQVLFAPVYFFVYLRSYKKAFQDIKFFLPLLLLAVFHLLFLFLYAITNPLIVGDFLDNIVTKVTTGSFLVKFFYSDLSYLTVPVAVFWIFYIGAKKLKIHSLFTTSKLNAMGVSPWLFIQSLLILTVTVFGYIISYPEPHYAAYAAFILLLVIGLTLKEWPRIGQRFTGLIIMVPIVTVFFLVYQLTPAQTFFYRYQKELKKIFTGEERVIGLGAFGYEIQYYLPVRVYKWPHQPEHQLGFNYALVFRPETLTDEDSGLLQTMSQIKRIENLSIYRLP